MNSGRKEIRQRSCIYVAAALMYTYTLWNTHKHSECTALEQDNEIVFLKVSAFGV